MAKEDASAAIQNALQKLDQQPSLLHNDEKLKSLKSNLHHFGSRLERFNSISKLTEVREVAYDAEDAMDDAIMVAATSSARKRWRKMGNSFLFFTRAGKPSQQLVEDQIDAVYQRSVSISSNSTFDGEEHVAEEQDISPLKSENKLFYLSLSGFPADAEVSARQLIQVWVAEGHLDLDRQGSTSMEMEEQGREKINWLVEKGFIKEASKGTCGELKTFKIEEDRLDACREAAKKHEFLHVSAGDDQETGEIKTTRLAIHDQATSLFPGNNLRRSVNLSKVRSLQFHFNNSNNTLYHRFSKSSTKKFESLRILDLGCFKLETVPEAIGKLTHLKYLRLRAPEATKIPASICNLLNLQTIDLKETERVKTMPVEIWNMKTNLRHLHLGGDGATALPPPQWANHYDALEKLQTLCGVRPDKELKRLMVRAKFPNVNRLRVQCTSKSDSPECLSFLNSLDLLSDLRSLTLRGPIEDLPSDWTAFPSSMTKMTLAKTLIPVGKCVETLEKLQNLRYLKLMEDSVTGEEMKCADGRFSALLVLRMIGLKELRSWTVGKGAMRLLGDLEVRECERLERVEAFQPSKKLSETLQKLQSEHERVTAVEVYPPPANADSNGTAS